MSEHFTSIGLFGKYNDPSVGETLHALAELLRGRELEVLVDEATAEVWPQEHLEVTSREVIGERCDLAIVVGGDGTMLNVARSLSNYDIAIIGINLGWLGFLTDISPAEMGDKLGEILNGRYNVEERFLLHSTIIRDGEQISTSDALNDVVIHKWDVARMIELETYINDSFVYSVRADGLIVSTPTGSSAYAMSAGGPLLQPSLNAMVMVPICPHTMSNRPIVIDGGSLVEVVVKGRGRDHAQVTCDGQINLGLVSGDRVQIRKKPHPVRMLHPLDHDHFHILRAKLNWG